MLQSLCISRGETSHLPLVEPVETRMFMSAQKALLLAMFFPTSIRKRHKAFHVVTGTSSISIDAISISRPRTTRGVGVLHSGQRRS